MFHWKLLGRLIGRSTSAKRSRRQSFALTVEQLEDRSVPAVIGTPDQNFVDQVYHDLLNRPADPAGLAFWTGLLNQGLSRTQLALDIENSVEQRIDQVQALYQNILGHPADSSGLIASTAFLALGGSVTQLEANLFSSPEFIQGQGGTFAGVAGGVFDKLIGTLDKGTFSTEAMTTEKAVFVQTWTPVLSAGSASLNQFAALVARGVEVENIFVTSLYSKLLGRDPDAAGQTLLTNFLLQGGSQDLLIAAVIGSDEYFQHASIPPVIVPTTPVTTAPGTTAVTLMVPSPGADLPETNNFTFTVTVAGAGATPTGNVTITFTDNTGASFTRTGTLASGSVSLLVGAGDPTHFIAGLNYKIVASYSGDASNPAAMSSTHTATWTDNDDGDTSGKPDDDGASANDTYRFS
jgi:hypothetical protein